MIDECMNHGVIFNAYPDSLSGDLCGSAQLLQNELRDCFSTFYILPSIFHSDLDRGFGIVDYGLNEEYSAAEGLGMLREAGMSLMLDIVLNHVSSSSTMFQDVLQHGTASPYCDFFIDWNAFWKDKGTLNDDGVIVPDEKYLRDMYFRKPGLPVLCVDLPDGTRVPFWNTFYQEVQNAQDGPVSIKAQLDLNVQSPLVWQYYEETLRTLASYGARIVRLDAFAYASKAAGKRNFWNEPETSDILARLKTMAGKYGITLLPEIHGTYAEHLNDMLSEQGYLTYDFFVPGLLLYAMEKQDPSLLAVHAREMAEMKTPCIHMLGCHDGIPVLDLKGLLDEEEIQKLINVLEARGGLIKNLHGAENMYYQVNTTYFSALGEDPGKMSFARAVQLFLPGIPLVWYLDLFEGENDYGAVARGGAGAHKEINRTNLSAAEIQERLHTPSVQEQLRLIHLRNTFPAFREGSTFECTVRGHSAVFRYTWERYTAELTADFRTSSYNVRTSTE
ncbi:MAG: hypothetical protein IJG05_08090 [Solobacterium sp.]|nr:hypothetical protein [Solobacterium sp.]